MKIIFLDIDGVLNCHYSQSRCQGFLGIDKDKLKLLKYIVNQTSFVDNPTKIVLTSTWKLNWDRYIHGTESEPKFSNKVGKYMREKFRECGLEIFDYTKETEPLTGVGLRDRGYGINKWLDLNCDITNWCVIDDEVFDDYSHYDIMDRLIETDASYGITQTDASKAIQILNKTTEEVQREKGLSYLPCIKDLYKYLCDSKIWKKFISCSICENKSSDLWKLFEQFINEKCEGKIK